MPNNIARQVLGVRVGETDTKEYIPPVSKGDLISYDDALVIPQGVVKTYSGSIPAAAFNTLNSAPFELVPASVSSKKTAPIAFSIKVNIQSGTLSQVYISNSFLKLVGDGFMTFDVGIPGIYFTRAQFAVPNPSFPLSGSNLPVTLTQIADDPTVSISGNSAYTVYYVEIDA
jgi:hypothetical protein